MLLTKAYSADLFRQTGHQLVDMLADYLLAAQSGELEKTRPYALPEAQLVHWQNDFAKPATDDPMPLFQEIIDRSLHLHHPRNMGHQAAPPAPLAALAGLLTNFLNNGMAIYETGPVSTAMERIVTDWFAAKIGYQEMGGGLLTSGGTLANLTGLLAARAAKSGCDVWKEGTSERYALLVSEEAHYSVDRAARILGWGEAGVIKIPANAVYQMRVDLLESYLKQAEAQGLKVIAVIGSACTTSTGSYDDLKAIADFCEKYGIWMHVDGAHGAPAVLSKKHQHLVAGIERADSVAVDFHKMMLTPATCTALIFKNPSHANETFQQKAQYLWDNQQSKDWYNSGKRAFECTKGMKSIKVYTLLRTYGAELFLENVETTYALAQEFAEMIKRNPCFNLAIQPQANIVCFRRTGAGDLNQLNQKVRQRLLEQGDYYIVQTKLRGENWLRVSLMNPLTTRKEMEHLLSELEYSL